MVLKKLNITQQKPTCTTNKPKEEDTVTYYT